MDINNSFSSKKYECQEIQEQMTIDEVERNITLGLKDVNDRFKDMLIASLKMRNTWTLSDDAALNGDESPEASYEHQRKYQGQEQERPLHGIFDDLRSSSFTFYQLESTIEEIIDERQALLSVMKKALFFVTYTMKLTDKSLQDCPAGLDPFREYLMCQLVPCLKNDTAERVNKGKKFIEEKLEQAQNLVSVLTTEFEKDGSKRPKKLWKKDIESVKGKLKRLRETSEEQLGEQLELFYDATRGDEDSHISLTVSQKHAMESNDMKCIIDGSYLMHIYRASGQIPKTDIATVEGFMAKLEKGARMLTKKERSQQHEKTEKDTHTTDNEDEGDKPSLHFDMHQESQVMEDSFDYHRRSAQSQLIPSYEEALRVRQNEPRSSRTPGKYSFNFAIHDFASSLKSGIRMTSLQFPVIQLDSFIQGTVWFLRSGELNLQVCHSCRRQATQTKMWIKYAASVKDIRNKRMLGHRHVTVCYLKQKTREGWEEEIELGKVDISEMGFDIGSQIVIAYSIEWGQV